MIADVVKEIEEDGLQKYIQTQRKEMYSEHKCKLIDRKLKISKRVFDSTDQVLVVIHEPK